MRRHHLLWIAVLLPAGCAVAEDPDCFEDWQCPGGWCDPLAGRCVEIPDAGVDDAGSCSPSDCETSCRSDGYGGGACLGTTCQCIGTPPDGGDDDSTDMTDVRPDTGCDPAACSTECAVFGRSGSCASGTCVCEGGGDTGPDTPPDDIAPEDTVPEDVAPEDIAPEDVAPEDVAPEDTGPATGPCPGPFSGSGDWGDSGFYCLSRYTFRVIAGYSYTISTCGSYSGDPYLVVSGACSCENDDFCGLGSQCTCTAGSTGTAEICASSYGWDYASWSYAITGECAL